MNVNRIAAVSVLLGVVAIFHLGCISSETSNTKVSMGVYLNREIQVDKSTSGEDSPPFANVIEGDSTLFLYSEYTDRGMEGDGYDFGFHIDLNSDSAAYSPITMEKRIIGYGTGFAPNMADTIKNYDFQVSVSGNAVRIRGEANGKNISGSYIPK